MRKIIILLFLLLPGVSSAHPIDKWINRAIEYAGTETKNNESRINAYAVNQEKLDMYRNAHPRYNFPKDIKNLNEKQAKQILSYFWDNYRFGDYKYDEIQEKVWDMMIHMQMSELEQKLNASIREYYNFDDNFFAPFGSLAGVSLLNGMSPKHVPDFYLILDKIKY